MSGEEFLRFGQFIEANSGIKMPPSKRIMLEARLRSRLRMHGMNSFTEYGNYVFGLQGWFGEQAELIDAATTNKTDFFREPEHFDYLLGNVLPELIHNRKKMVRIWSAGCSTGEEPYTLAMVLSEFAEGCRGVNFSVLATDISGSVLEKGNLGVYEQEKVEPIPAELKKKYLLKSRDRRKGLVRIVPELRRLVKFRKQNLIDRDFELTSPMDIIFFRNVLIYFERPVQQRLLDGICRHLNPGGYLFVGHAESLNGVGLSMERKAPSVYRK